MEYLVSGLTLGLAAGISPGPLMALVVAASLRNGLGGGLRAAVAPLLTDLPIVTLALFVMSRLPEATLRWVGAAGSLVVAWLGVELLRSVPTADLPQADGTSSGPGSELLRGVVVNLTNPHPYLFWAAVGAPTVLEAWAHSVWQAMAFLAGFYALLVGVKVALAWGVSQAHGLLSTRGYRIAMALSGSAMLLLAGNLLWQVIRP